MTSLWGISLVSLLIAGLPAGAQQQRGVPQAAVTPAVTGAVSGRVTCSDTQRPARFADVTLVPVADAAGEEDDRFGGRGRRGSARTDLDGNYTVAGLPAGQYYAMASATGYVSTMTAIAARAGASADTAALMAQMPQVQVSGSGTSTANLSLERGAVIAGKVLFDDGSPATGVQVNAVVSTALNAVALGRRGGGGFGGAGGPGGLGGLGFGPGGGSGSVGETDDRGNFRLTGLAPGDYLVRANFAAPGVVGSAGGAFNFPGFGRTVNITLYAPGKVRKSDAQTVTLALGEERGDVLFTADLRSLHSVAGRVSATGDPQVHSGSVRLVDTTDATLTRNAPLNADGTFTLSYVPAGTYTLSANASSATAGPGFGGGGRRGGNSSTASSTPVTTFQPLQQTLSVADGDVAGVNLTVLPQTAASTVGR